MYVLEDDKFNKAKKKRINSLQTRNARLMGSKADQKQ